jgi:hypothetical protein
MWLTSSPHRICCRVRRQTLGRRPRGHRRLPAFRSPRICHLLVGAPELVVAPGHRRRHTWIPCRIHRRHARRAPRMGTLQHCHSSAWLGLPAKGATTGRLNGSALTGERTDDGATAPPAASHLSSLLSGVRVSYDR